MSQAEKYFETRLAEDPRREKLWRYLTRYLQQFVPDNAAVLEIGAGYCYFINNVAAGRRVALDLAPDLARRAGAGVEPISDDAMHFLRHAPEEQFDFILASNFFEHFDWPQLEEMLGLLHRVLRPRGTLAIIQPNFRLVPGRYFDDYTHRAIFTDVSLGDWLRSGDFDVVKLVPRFLPFTVKSAGGGLTFLVPLYLRLPFRPFAGQMFALAEKK